MSAERTTRRSLASLKANRKPTDWRQFDGTTDADIEATAHGDRDAAPLADESWFEDARVVEPSTKAAISIRIDKDVLDWFKQSSGRYQSKMNAVLRAYMEHEKSKRRA